jgi:hypothetical protein
LGWAVSALEDEGLLSARESVLEDIEKLPGGSLSDRFAYAGRLGYLFPRERESVFAVLDLWEEWWGPPGGGGPA